MSLVLNHECIVGSRQNKKEHNCLSKNKMNSFIYNPQQIYLLDALTIKYFDQVNLGL